MGTQTFRWLACVGISSLLLLSNVVVAQPVLTVTDNGLDGSLNREWLVHIAPDPALFVGGSGSLAAELAFELMGSTLVSASVNAPAWPFPIPGNNPFTGGLTTGLQTNLATSTVFASFGSDPFTSGAVVTFMTIVSAGSGPTTLRWGGHTLLPGTPQQYTGSRIAQAGLRFDGYQGELSAGGSTVTGDFNSDNLWDCLDINALSNAIATGSGNLLYDMNGDGFLTLADIMQPSVGWLAVAGANNPAATGGNPFLPGDADLSGSVDGSDFGAWNANKFTAQTAWCAGNFNADLNVDGSDFGVWNANKFTSSTAIVVPEPWPGITWALVALGWIRRIAFVRP